MKDVDLKKRKLVGAIYETVQAGRNLRAQAKIPSNQKAKYALRSIQSERESRATARRLPFERRGLRRRRRAARHRVGDGAPNLALRLPQGRVRVARA